MFFRVRNLLRLIPPLLSVVLLLAVLPFRDFAYTVLAIGCHEWGHAAVYYVLTGTLPRLSRQNGGLLLSALPQSDISEVFYASGGILLNLLSGGASMAFYPYFPENVAAFAAISLLYAGFNLLPSPPLDGEKILKSLLQRRFGEKIATRITGVCGKTVALLLFFCGLYLFIGTGSGFYALFIAGSVYTALQNNFGGK